MQLCCTLHAAHTVGQAITDVTLRSKNKMRLPNCGRRNDTNRDGGIKKKARRPEAFRDVIIRRDRPLAGMVRLDKLALRVLFFFYTCYNKLLQSTIDKMLVIDAFYFLNFEGAISKSKSIHIIFK
jgi:hypothetical protein